jgi:hypothetical protein
MAASLKLLPGSTVRWRGRRYLIVDYESRARNVSSARRPIGGVVRVPQGLAPWMPGTRTAGQPLFSTLARRALVGWATAVLPLVREHTGRNRSRCRCATEGAEGATPYFPRCQARLDPRQYWRRNIKLRTARRSARGSMGSGAGFRCFAAG